VPFAEYFYRTHDPTTLNSQGVDSGTRAFQTPPPCLFLMWTSTTQNTALPFSSIHQSKRRLPVV
jgi:peptide methionine sulfoxide reductase MsrA